MNNNMNMCTHKNFEVVRREETYPVFGENTTIIANVKVCKDCGKDIFDFKLDDENIKRAFAKYKRNHALMTSEDIIALRKKYGISQRTLATLIGCSQATIVRYEKGDIQDNTHNNIMRMLAKPENMAELLEIKEEELGEREIANIKNSLELLANIDGSTDELLDNVIMSLGIKPDQYSGFKEFDFYKFLAMVVYFANSVTNLYKTKLLKMLWYADMLFFREYTVSISGMNYYHQHYGPVPKSYNLILGVMEKMGDIVICEKETKYGDAEIIKAGEKDTSADCLTQDEIDVLQTVCNRFGNMTAGEISECSHKENGYIYTGDKELISYKYAMQMDT